MATKDLTMTTPSTGNGLKIVYLFDVPRQQGWRAWTDPNMANLWWGPKIYTAPLGNIDLKVGGKYLSCMRSLEGKDYYSTGTYREIVAPERLVMIDSFADANGNIVSANYFGMDKYFPRELWVTVTLDEYERGKTKLTLIHSGMPEGKQSDMAAAEWKETFEKLVKILKQ